MWTLNMQSNSTNHIVFYFNGWLRLVEIDNILHLRYWSMDLNDADQMVDYALVLFELFFGESSSNLIKIKDTNNKNTTSLPLNYNINNKNNN